MPEQQLTSYKDGDQALNLANGNKSGKKREISPEGFADNMHAATGRRLQL
jgi:hypothetical protein